MKKDGKATKPPVLLYVATVKLYLFVLSGAISTPVWFDCVGILAARSGGFFD